MTKEIKLTNGKHALVDDEDFDLLNKFNWCATKITNTYYANRAIVVNGEQYQLRMHRVILGFKKGDGKQSDHINGNGLDNRRSNLRECTSQQNNFNRSANVNAKSKYKGVKQKKNKKWEANIQFNKKKIYIGSFDNEDDAGRAYDKKATELFGDFARLNFPQGGSQ